MRIRTFRPQDSDELFTLHQQAAVYDDTVALGSVEFMAWLEQGGENAFVITDDDDELQTWGQAGTLEGVEGEIAGYTVVQLSQNEQGYHFLCQGTVLPALRRQYGGSVLFVGALNRARLLAYEFEFEAEEAGLQIYFEALLPIRDAAAARLASRYEMEPVAENVTSGMQLYRRTL